jgi:hypothetical protein
MISFEVIDILGLICPIKKEVCPMQGFQKGQRGEVPKRNLPDRYKLPLEN